MKQCESSTLCTLGCEGCSLPDALIKCTAFDSQLSYDAPVDELSQPMCLPSRGLVVKVDSWEKEWEGECRKAALILSSSLSSSLAYIARVKLSSRPVSIAMLSRFHKFNFNLCFMPGFPLYFPFRFSCSPRFFKCQCIRVVRSAFHSPLINVGN